jgi:carbon storage regulator
MLVLTRKPEEALLLGSETDPHGVVTVTVLSIVGNRVKLGFQMQDGVSVYRMEVWNRIQEEARSMFESRELESVGV